MTEKTKAITKINPVLQSKPEGFSNFERNFNALKTINDALNRFPNLIEMSEKIKLAKTDLEIINLLLQICVNSPQKPYLAYSTSHILKICSITTPPTVLQPRPDWSSKKLYKQPAPKELYLHFSAMTASLYSLL
ncbi:hypothetical protein AVEN_85874-1 [Araneus ventricosus]|uniref:Uncharacterized protein n=1 Tax=Araneus ventricosus TaxID=182803 RepID=A0A4Y2QK21_ARAVE|nr:hypothetical protein AVEN_85874-1 [Araneus ventricosus]